MYDWLLWASCRPGICMRWLGTRQHSQLREYSYHSVIHSYTHLPNSFAHSFIESSHVDASLWVSLPHIHSTACWMFEDALYTNSGVCVRWSSDADTDTATRAGGVVEHPSWSVGTAVNVSMVCLCLHASQLAFCIKIFCVITCGMLFNNANAQWFRFFPRVHDVGECITIGKLEGVS